MAPKKKPGRPKGSKAVPKTPRPARNPKDPTLDSAATLKRSIKAWLSLLSWAEQTVEKITAGDQDPTISLLDSLLKIISTTAEKLPDLQDSAGEAKRSQGEVERDTKEQSWSTQDEMGFLGDMVANGNLAFCEEYLASPGNEDDIKEYLKGIMKEAKDNPPPDPPEPPKLNLP
jgi:hypothetical protein